MEQQDILLLHRYTTIFMELSSHISEPHEPATPPPTNRTQSLVLAMVAGLAWAAATTLLLFVQFPPGFFHYQRLLLYGLVLLASLLTFFPIQQQLSIPGLVFQATTGLLLLYHTLAFVPPPTGTPLDLPDTPVYLLLALAIFLSASAIALPIMYGVGQRIFQQRTRQYDLRRSRRQAAGVGILLAISILMAGLHVLTPLSVILLTCALIAAEMLFLSFVQPEVGTA